MTGFSLVRPLQSIEAKETYPQVHEVPVIRFRMHDGFKQHKLHSNRFKKKTTTNKQINKQNDQRATTTTTKKKKKNYNCNSNNNNSFIQYKRRTQQTYVGPAVGASKGPKM